MVGRGWTVSWIGGSHVDLMLQSMWEKKKWSISMVCLAVARRVSRLEVVRQCGTADIVASWVPEDDEEHGGLVGA